MPTYEYVCQHCQYEFELYQSFSEKAVKKCPECKKNKLEKVISGGAGIVFKGDGFYETDYNRSEGSDYKKKADAESGKSKKSNSSGKETKNTKKEAKKKPTTTKKE